MCQLTDSAWAGIATATTLSVLFICITIVVVVFLSKWDGEA